MRFLDDIAISVAFKYQNNAFPALLNWRSKQFALETQLIYFLEAKAWVEM